MRADPSNAEFGATESVIGVFAAAPPPLDPLPKLLLVASDDPRALVFEHSEALAAGGGGGDARVPLTLRNFPGFAVVVRNPEAMVQDAWTTSECLCVELGVGPISTGPDADTPGYPPLLAARREPGFLAVTAADAGQSQPAADPAAAAAAAAAAAGVADAGVDAGQPVNTTGPIAPARTAQDNGVAFALELARGRNKKGTAVQLLKSTQVADGEQRTFASGGGRDFTVNLASGQIGPTWGVSNVLGCEFVPVAKGITAISISQA